MNDFKCTPIEPITITIDKEYFRKKFIKVLDEWDLKLDHIDRKYLIEELMECFDGKDEE